MSLFGSRVSRAVLFLPRQLGGWVRHAPRWLQVVLAVGTVLAVGVGGGYGYKRWDASRTNRAAQAGWRHFDEAAHTGDVAAMGAALDEVLAARPDEPTALARKKTLADGESPANDKDMVLFAMRRNLRENKLPQAEREADKWLVFEPKDWLARCIKVHGALGRGDRAAAQAELDALPDPGDKRAKVEPAGLMMAFRLYRVLERDTTPLRNFVQNRVCPFLRGATAQNFPAVDKVSLVSCYLEGFEPPSEKLQPLALLEAWAGVMKLMDSAADEALAGADAALLSRMGRLGPQLLAALAAFKATGQMADEQAQDYGRDTAERTRKLWAALKDKDPKAPESYRGLALGLAAAGQFAEARAMTVEGLRACENDPDLSLLFSQILQGEGRAMEAYLALESLTRKEPEKPVWWALTADAALAANRRDLALDACERMRKAFPGNVWATRTEARLRLEAGDANKAAQLLHPIGLERLANDTQAARLYVRALAEAGLETQIAPFLAQSEKLSQELNAPVALEAAFRGWLEAKPDAARATGIAEQLQRFQGRWPEAGELYRLRAEALFRVAEVGTPPWESARAAAAVQAAERFRAKEPLDRGVAFLLGTLRVNGERNPGQAYRDVAPLRDAESDPTLSVAQLELLGTVYRLNNKLADAARVLERACRSQAASAGCFTQLSLTYRAQGKRPEARVALAGAQVRPRNPQEQLDYVAAAQALQRETP